MNVREIGNSAFTPEYVLRQALSQVDQMAEIVIVIREKDGLTQTFASMMTAEVLALLSARLQFRLFSCFKKAKVQK